MKIVRFIKEEVIPLSRKQNIVLLTIIACIFQFTLFYAPALADAAVQEANASNNIEEIISINNSIVKEAINNQEIEIIDNNNNISTEASSTIPFVVTTKNVSSSTEEVIILRESTHTMTAYNSEVGQTDDSPCITANGFNVCKHGIEDTIAANFLPMGAKIKIPELFGDRIFIVRDRMNKKHPNRVDVWMKDRHDAIQFGVKIAKIQVIK